MASIFQAYDQEYSALSAEIQKGISDIKNSEKDDGGKAISQTEALLGQASDLIKQMEVEVRSHDAATRKVLSDKVATYKRSVTSLQTDFKKAREVAERSSLIGAKSGEQRQRLLDVNEKVARQNETIMNAQRTVAETEDVGIEIISELSRNREKIESARGRVTEFSGVTDSARRLLSSMARRDVQQRFILCFIGIVLVIAIAVTIYFTTSGSSSSSKSK